jgi:hypothetical protein
MIGASNALALPVRATRSLAAVGVFGHQAGDEAGLGLLGAGQEKNHEQQGHAEEDATHDQENLGAEIHASTAG